MADWRESLGDGCRPPSSRQELEEQRQRITSSRSGVKDNPDQRLRELGDSAEAEELRAVRRQVAENWRIWEQRLQSIDAELQQDHHWCRRAAGARCAGGMGGSGPVCSPRPAFGSGVRRAQPGCCGAGRAIAGRAQPAHNLRTADALQVARCLQFAGDAVMVTADAAFQRLPSLRLVERFAPETVILFGSLARGEGCWDSDADILVVMPFEGPSRHTVRAMLDSCEPESPLDLHLRRPEEIAPRDQWGDPYIREALDHGEGLHGHDGPRLSGISGNLAQPATPTRNPVVEEWIERAERHGRMATLLPDLPPGYRSGLFQVQRCLETDLRAALIALGIPSRKERDLLKLSERLGTAIPGWAPDPETLTILTQAALAYLDPGEGDPEPSQDGAWAIAQAGPLRDCLRHWFAGLEGVSPRASAQEMR